MTGSNLFSFKHLPTINTERLLLRDIQADDAEAIWSYSSNPVFYQSMGRSAPTSKERVLSNIQNILSGEDTGTPRNWMVVLKSSGKIIGDCGFNEYRPSNLRGEVNYAIDPAYWNQGFATEAVLRVIEFGFEEIRAESYSGNLQYGKQGIGACDSKDRDEI